ncbi:transketolase C-terminal domain-containing protein [Pigmentibacter sp. JX0631]|uniref:transketolase family protein n=1 Tax=Pigmentibacter sp. JX0631 TaxID=2976982 RepID=UPI00246862B5|nr:transketolase C-terminal domain-containing protein [Pigmentibacter sp. JX0631]WGL60826.1 transketolase C-terminal domain-containing protein [Pigmentibacter sp. JX0631]
MRETISNFLAETALNNPDFYVLSGDHGYALFDEIRKSAPKQFINVGVSEQAMVGYAAGMIKQGLKVVIYGLSSFVPIRVIEFIKMDICYESLPLIILGDGAGLVYSTLGPSHQSAEDIACMRSLPNINIFSPADKYEMSASLNKALILNSPSYIRIGKSDKPCVHNQSFQMPKVSRLISISESYSNENCIVATGSMVSTGINISKKLNVDIFSFIELTNFDEKIVVDQIKKYKNVFTLEEHSINGGIGSILSEVIAENGLKINLKRIGIKNKFSQKCGSYEYLMKEHELDESSIYSHLSNFIENKG